MVQSSPVGSRVGVIIFLVMVTPFFLGMNDDNYEDVYRPCDIPRGD